MVCSSHLACLLTWSAALGAHSDLALPLELRSALETQERSLSMIAVRWTESRPENEEQNDKPFVVLSVRVILQDGKKFVEKSGVLARTDLRGETTTTRVAFDGETLYEWYESQNQNMAISNATRLRRESDDPAPVFEEPYFLRAAGFHVPGSARTLADSPRSLILYLVENGAVVRDVIRGPAEARVDLTRAGYAFRFFLDPDRGYALIRQEVRVIEGDGREALAIEIRNSGLKQFGRHEVWLPRQCTIEKYYPRTRRIPDIGILLTRPVAERSEPAQRLHIEVLEWSDFPIPESAFAIPANSPGLMVSDSRVPGAESSDDGYIQYWVPQDPAHLLDVLMDATGRRSSYGEVMVWAIPILVFAAALVVRLTSRSRTAQSGEGGRHD